MDLFVEKTIQETLVFNSRVFFPTCQVRVVRFYHSCSPPPPPPPPPRLAILLLLLLLLLRQHLLHQLSVHRWTSTWDLPSSVGTAGPQPGTFRAQWAPLPSSVCTAGPQPGTCPAQCAPLDLNLGPAQLSVHRWTSTAR